MTKPSEEQGQAGANPAAGGHAATPSTAADNPVAGTDDLAHMHDDAPTDASPDSEDPPADLSDDVAGRLERAVPLSPRTCVTDCTTG